MKVHLDCIACHQRQALRVLRLMSDDVALHERALRQVAAHLAETNWDTDPMTLTDGIYRVINRLTGIPDPYKALKQRSNEEVLHLYPELQDRVRTSADPLLTACKIAVAGNIMDFAAREHFDIRETVEHVLENAFDINHYAAFQDALRGASTLLLFADNAGEIVCDKLLLETIMARYPLRKITMVVKGTPILNDAMLDDARQVGLTDFSEIEFLTVTSNPSSNGRSAWMHPDAEALIQAHDVAISKGQANYEIMSELRGLFFLLIAKCEIVARDSGTYNGALICQQKQ
jgi:damage-control phosphatase, subfamily I